MGFGLNAGNAMNPARDFGPRLFTFLAGYVIITMAGFGCQLFVQCQQDLLEKEILHQPCLNQSETKSFCLEHDITERAYISTTAVHPALECRLGNRDPWDAAILPFLNPQAKGPMADCKPTFEDLMSFSKPSSDKSSTLKIRSDKSDLECVLNDKSVWKNLYYQIFRQKLTNKMVEKQGFGVQLLVIDSISRNQVFRSMNATVFLLREEFEAIPFHYLNKNAVNSRPNAYSFLMGRQSENLPRSPLNDESIKQTTAGSTPRRAATNLWIMSSPSYTTPADHYMKPFQLRAGTFFPQKGLTWPGSLAHDDPNQLYHSDEQFYQLLKGMKSKLDNSFFILMGDHGPRFGAMRKTDMGQIEDNNPALFISLPKKLRQNADLIAIMKENSHQLISQHDVYATLLEIAKDSHKWNSTHWDSTHWPSPNHQDLPHPIHGSSLLHKLKQPRNCPSLLIPFEYCQCDWKFTHVVGSNKSNEISVKAVQQLAQAAVDHLNQLLINAKLNNVCAVLKISEKEGAVELKRFEQHQKANEDTSFSLTFLTEPADGHFRAYLQARFVKTNGPLELQPGSIRFLSDPFPRLNLYEKGKCAKDFPVLEAYCHCLTESSSGMIYTSKPVILFITFAFFNFLKNIKYL
uniref:Iduronate 2-sulfatase n=1 Tax=Ditylenchus dipsaci TaxID=166011 RepID=A0A915D289_9BILA